MQYVVFIGGGFIIFQFPLRYAIAKNVFQKNMYIIGIYIFYTTYWLSYDE
jgi:hypothetical protein